MQYSQIVKTVKLPMVGFGTFRIKGYDVVHQALSAAIGAGYRLIDTASAYGNEGDIGKCLFDDILPRNNLTRADIFITTKLDPRSHGRKSCRATCQRSLEELRCGYIDLYLIHWPGVSGMDKQDPKQKILRRESYEEMEAMHREGLIKSLGVSNYTVNHLKELLDTCSIKPIVNQVEYHPYLVQPDLHKFCIQHGIQLEAYSSLGSTQDNELLMDKTVADVAKKYNKSPAQILLKWALQQDIIVLPKSTTPERMVENIDIFSFSLDPADLDRLSSLNRDRHFRFNPYEVV